MQTLPGAELIAAVSQRSPEPGHLPALGGVRPAELPGEVTASRDLGLHLMRFVMMEHLLPPEEVLTFLHDLAALSAAPTP
jgi:hypothetical protein